jgi:cytochrome P450
MLRAKQEVDRVAPNGIADFTPETMAAMDYLEACANEAMRLKPVAPFLPLQALQDTVVGDIAVPAGTLVWNVLRHDSVSSEHVPNPQAFDPERWLGGDSHIKHVSTPFGSGPRICPGRYLALLEIKMAMAMLLHRFDVASVDTPDGKEARELMAFTMGPDGLTMTLRALPGRT